MSDHPHEPPSVTSLLIAERVFRDRETGEWIIAGVFNTIHVGELPTVHPRLEAFFQLTNVRKNVDLHFRVEHASGTVVLEFGGAVTASTPLQVVENRVVLKNVPFNRAGRHWVQLLSREEILTQAPLFINLESEEPTHGKREDQNIE